jgi:hypothetical protein
VLKITKEHIYGSQENHEIHFIKLKLDKTGLDEKEALNNGWLIDSGKWYQCRSVRINISEYLTKTKKPKLPESLKFHWFYREQITEKESADIISIFDQFTKQKGFEAEYDINSDSDRSNWLIVYDDEVPVAFTKFVMYKPGIESQFTAWNYHNPKLSLGKNIVWYEMQCATTFCTDKYLYIGQGYEKGSMYKSDFAGFEWWDGEKWTGDKEEYRRLCTQDSTINTLQDLSEVYKNA